MRAALYIRVSTVAQAVEGYSLDAQRHTLEAYCAAHDYDITAVYIDGGISGKETLTTALMQLKCFVMSRITSLI